MSHPFADAVCTLIEENFAAIGSILSELGDSRVSTTPPLPETNSPYAIAFHCVGMTQFWLGSVIGGERIPRDRAAEFTATGSVADIRTAIDDVCARVPAWVHIACTEGVRDRDVEGSTRGTDVATRSAEWMLLHVVRELAQHLGQLEVTRDILASGRG